MKTSNVTKKNHAIKKNLNNYTKPIFKCLFGLKDEYAPRSKKLKGFYCCPWIRFWGFRLKKWGRQQAIRDIQTQIVGEGA